MRRPQPTTSLMFIALILAAGLGLAGGPGCSSDGGPGDAGPGDGGGPLDGGGDVASPTDCESLDEGTCQKTAGCRADYCRCGDRTFAGCAVEGDPAPACAPCAACADLDDAGCVARIDCRARYTETCDCSCTQDEFKGGCAAATRASCCTVSGCEVGPCVGDDQCSGGQVCCYPCGIGGCENECIDPAPEGGCPLFP